MSERAGVRCPECGSRLTVELDFGLVSEDEPSWLLAVEDRYVLIDTDEVTHLLWQNLGAIDVDCEACGWALRLNGDAYEHGKVPSDG